ncbi:MAG TPA: hypothetical protein VH475_26580 [Tepidisphaeraceae bacterium]|jgi:hypothetical protein
MSSSHEFASQLSNLGLPPAMDPSALAARALARNRRRIRTLATLTIGLWTIAFLMVPSLWMPFAAKMKHDAHLLVGDDGKVIPTNMETLARLLHDLMNHVAVVSGFILAVMTLASLLAAISTVWLVLTVRRVTLEQVSMGLAQISEQLKRMPPEK